MIFDLFIENSGLFENVIRTKEHVVVIYDPSDELINFHCSAYSGIIFLLSKIYSMLRKNKTKMRMKNKPGFWNSLLALPRRLRTTEGDFNMQHRLMKRIEPLISKQEIDDLSLSLTRLFSLIKSVDINAYLEDSLRMSRRYSSSYPLESIISELDGLIDTKAANGQAVCKSKKPAESYDYDMKELLKELENLDNGLKEVFIKFVKFSNRLTVCSLSLFDIYYMKNTDTSYLVMFLWLMQFMEEMSLLGKPDELKSKYNFILLSMSNLNRYRQLRARNPRVLREAAQLPQELEVVLLPSNLTRSSKT
jgi:hypothetical protein